MRAVSFDHLLNVVVFAGFGLFLAHESTENANAILSSVLAAKVRGAEASSATVAVRLSLLHLAEDLVVEGLKLAENEGWPTVSSCAWPVEEAICSRHVYDGRQTVDGLDGSSRSC